VSISGVFPTGLGKVIGGEVWSVMPGGNDFYFVLVVSGGEMLLKQLNGWDGVETCYMKGQEGGMDERWKLDRGEVVCVLWLFVNENVNVMLECQV
jgi:hypothetical protein